MARPECRRTRQTIENDERITMKNRKQMYLLNYAHDNGREIKENNGIKASSRTKLRKNFRNLKTKP